VRSWYTRAVGAGWLAISLDSNCNGPQSCAPGSPQYEFLKRALASLPDQPCVVASWHHPRFTTGDHQSDPRLAPMFDLLAAKHVPLLLSGHNHHYERIVPAGPSGPSGSPAPGSTVQVVVGTGGRSLDPSVPPAPFDAKVIDGTFGVLSLAAKVGGAAATFVDLDGRVRDSFAVTCTPVSVPTPVAAKARSSASWTAKARSATPGPA
jgi:hypothetical protein